MLSRCGPLRAAWRATKNRSKASISTLPLTIKQLLASSPDTTVNTAVTGFVKSIRKQKRYAFADISDGSTPFPLQAVIETQKLGVDVIHQ